MEQKIIIAGLILMLVVAITIQFCGDDGGSGPVLSNNANLPEITLDGITLASDFSADITDYTASASNDVDSFTITLPANSYGASYSINGEAVEADTPKTINLDVGENTITIVITAQDGTTSQTYTLFVTREDEDEPIYTTAPTISSYGTLTDIGGDQYTVAVTFSEDVSNANLEANYQVNAGSVSPGSVRHQQCILFQPHSHHYTGHNRHRWCGYLYSGSHQWRNSNNRWNQ